MDNWKLDIDLSYIGPLSRHECAKLMSKMSEDIARMDPNHRDTYTQMCALQAEMHYFEESRPL